MITFIPQKYTIKIRNVHCFMLINFNRHVSAYFPEGTRCHTDKDGIKYYCQKDLCLPEHVRVPRSAGKAKGNPDYVRLDKNMNPIPGSGKKVQNDGGDEEEEFEQDTLPLPSGAKGKK